MNEETRVAKLAVRAQLQEYWRIWSARPASLNRRIRMAEIHAKLVKLDHELKEAGVTWSN